MVIHKCRINPGEKRTAKTGLYFEKNDKKTENMSGANFYPNAVSSDVV